MEKISGPLDLARRLIAIDTCNPPGNEGKVADLLGALLETAGFGLARLEHAPGRVSLVARRAGGGRRAPLCLTGHGDTVPLGGAAWSREPFAAQVEGGRLYGRGASDMKAGLAAMVWAACELARRPLNEAGLTVVVCADEENGCQGSRHLAAHPDALGPAGAMIVAEPSANQPWLGHKGVLWLKAAYGGKAAHASMPQAGDNAIYKAARAVGALAGLDFGGLAHPHLGGPTVNVGTIQGGTRINMVPDAAELGVDLRSVPGLDQARLRRMAEAALGPEAVVTELDNTPAVWTEPSDPWVQTVWGIVREITGRTPAPGGAPYFTDASHLRRAFGPVPTLILGPGEPGQAHQTDEWCEVAKIEQAAAAYLEIARRWCGA
ncbi:MAG: M20 family metallopeptidase [Thermodesulfobacteriota bacterium]